MSRLPQRLPGATIVCLIWLCASALGGQGAPKDVPEAIAPGSLRPVDEASERPVVHCARPRESARLDGVFDKPMWEEADAPHTIPALFRRSSGRRATPGTELRFAQTGRTLRIAARCASLEPPPGERVQEQREPDRLELMFDVEGRGDSYLVLALSEDGEASASHVRLSPSGGRSISAAGVDWEHAVRRGAGEWTAEVAIPFSALRIPEDSAGTLLPLNVRRDSGEFGGASLWAAPAEAVSPLRFGWLAIGNPQPRVRLDAIEDKDGPMGEARLTVWNLSRAARRIRFEVVSRWAGGRETNHKEVTLEPTERRQISISIIHRTQDADLDIVAREAARGTRLFQQRLRFERRGLTLWLPQPSCPRGAPLLPVSVLIPESLHGEPKWLSVSIENSDDVERLAASNLVVNGSGPHLADLLPADLPPGTYTIRARLLDSREDELSAATAGFRIGGGRW